MTGESGFFEVILPAVVSATKAIGSVAKGLWEKANNGLFGNILGDLFSDKIQCALNRIEEKIKAEQEAKVLSKCLDAELEARTELASLFEAMNRDFNFEAVQKPSKLKYKKLMKELVKSFKNTLISSDGVKAYLEKSRSFQAAPLYLQQAVFDIVWGMRQGIYERCYDRVKGNQANLLKCIEGLLQAYTAAESPAGYYQRPETIERAPEIHAAMTEEYRENPFVFIKRECPNCHTQHGLHVDMEKGVMRCSSCGCSYEIAKNVEEFVTIERFETGIGNLRSFLWKIDGKVEQVDLKLSELEGEIRSVEEAVGALTDKYGSIDAAIKTLTGFINGFFDVMIGDVKSRNEEEEQVKAALKPWVCPTCGDECKAEDKYCARCGTEKPE